ncbi:MAG: hypothetical protein ISR77_11565 [Pirellulaceae bacterium]|nr:hypothetical protein [Pirellulaceae bacterium]
MSQPNDRSNRSVSIGGDATGNVIQTGDHNVASLQFTQTTLPSPESVDIKAELASLRELLGQLQSEDRKKIDRAFEDAHDELAKSEPSRDEVGDALDRAIKYAKKAEGFAETAASLKGHITNVVSWLGDNWHKLLPVVGLTL